MKVCSYSFRFSVQLASFFLVIYGDFLSFVSCLNNVVVRDASGKAFAALPDVSKAVSELTVLKSVGPATASAVLAAYAPDVAMFMSDEVF
ncbi:DNA binding protein [Perilla frutescens var. hirtella]|nr:DNA binding protein [Perilla frutescens var. hirtella]